MLKTAIFVQYAKNETALAATQLADWLLRCGINVSMLSRGRVEQGVNKYWDSRTLSYKKGNIYKWAHNATHICWFHPDNKAFNEARIVTKYNKKQKTKTIFVPNWQQNEASFYDFANHADKLMCLNKSTYDWLKGVKLKNFRTEAEKVYVNMVPPRNILIPRTYDNKLQEERILIFLPKPFHMDIGLPFISTIGQLLQDEEKKITVLSECSLPATMRSSLNKLSKQYPDRFKAIYNPPYYRYSQIAKSHDFLYAANTRHTFGTSLSLFLASTIPVICNAVLPISGDLIKNGVNGILLPCNSIARPYPVASIETDNLSESISKAVKKVKRDNQVFRKSSLSLFKCRQDIMEKFVSREFLDYDIGFKIL